MRGHAYVVHIVGVHGIGQGGTGKQQIADDWEDALWDGIEDLGDVQSCELDFELAYWTDLLSPGASHLGPEDDLVGEGVPLEGDEAAFVISMFEDELGRETVERIEQAPDDELGPPATLPVVSRLIVELDRRNKSGNMGRRLVRASREVYQYLFKPELARTVRHRVAQGLQQDTSVVVAHSLGSVIAYDLFRGDETPESWRTGKRTLITCGSPLGFPTVRRALGFDDGRVLDPLPGTRWVNVYDRKDVVTGGRGLHQEPFVTDEPVVNGLKNPHDACKYLRKVPVARTVVDAGE